MQMCTSTTNNKQKWKDCRSCNIVKQILTPRVRLKKQSHQFTFFTDDKNVHNILMP